jgi:predicted HTH transcriptional regulator
MTPVQLQAKLDELRALPGETEWVEFKHAERNFDFDDLGKYFPALSNEANLKGQAFGWLGFGIKDKTHDIVGTQFRPRRPQLDSLKQEVAVHTTNRLTFEEIHELVTPGGRVILFQIPAASRGSPTAWKGHFYGRNGESLGALSLHEIEQIRGQSRAFEPEIALAGVDGDGVVDLLDTEAYFRLMKQKLPPNRAAVLARLEEEHLIAASSANRFDVTNLGAILFARDLNRFGRLGRKTLRVIKYKGTGRVLTEREWNDPPSKMGYAAGFEAAISFINSQLPENEHIGEALRREERVYPQIAIRELVANTLIHQDFSVTGAGPMVEIFDDRMELTNPGEPLVDPQRFIDTPPRSRNEALAGFMRRLNICEERGSGIDKVIFTIEMFQLPPPDFRVPPGSTQVLLLAPQTFAEMDSVERVRACYQHCVLCWVSNKVMTNSTLRQRFGIADGNYSMASRVIRDTLNAKLIKKASTSSQSTRDTQYIPFWA